MLVAALDEKLQDQRLHLELGLHLGRRDLGVVALDRLLQRGDLGLGWVHDGRSEFFFVRVVDGNIVFTGRQ